MQNEFLKLTLLYVEDDDVIRQNAVEYLGRATLKKSLKPKMGKRGLSVMKTTNPI